MNLWHYKDLLGEHFVLQILLEVLAVGSEMWGENKGVETQRFCEHFQENPTLKFRDWGVPVNEKKYELGKNKVKRMFFHFFRQMGTEISIFLKKVKGMMHTYLINNIYI